MGKMITYHGYNNGYNNPMYNVHQNMDVHYKWQNTVSILLCISIEPCIYTYQNSYVTAL